GKATRNSRNGAPRSRDLVQLLLHRSELPEGGGLQLLQALHGLVRAPLLVAPSGFPLLALDPRGGKCSAGLRASDAHARRARARAPPLPARLRRRACARWP